MRYSRTLPGDKYLTSTAVFFAELFKLIACILLIYWEKRSVNGVIDVFIFMIGYKRKYY